MISRDRESKTLIKIYLFVRPFGKRGKKFPIMSWSKLKNRTIFFLK